MKKGVDYIGVCVVFFCHNGRGKVLLSKRTNKVRDEFGKWDVGGGGVNFSEPILKALAREIREEYCTSIIKSELLGFRDVHRIDDQGRKTHWIAIDFIVLVDPKKVKNGEPNKHGEPQWFSLDQLPRPMHSQWPEFRRLYKDKIFKK